MPHKGHVIRCDDIVVECIGKDKAQQPYEFGVKVGGAVTHKEALEGAILEGVLDFV